MRVTLVMARPGSQIAAAIFDASIGQTG